MYFAQNQTVKGHYALNFNILKQVRKLIYDSFERGADALFNLCDALLCEDQARSLPELSQSPCFERAWSSLYQALEHGKINETELREAWVKTLLAETPMGETIWISVDASSIPRPEAETSADRGIIHVSNLPRAVKPISVGWQFSTVMLLPQEPCSWVGILDQRRISTEQTAIEVAIAQLQTLVPLLQRPIIVVADRWYATADFLRACQPLGCQVLIRLKRNRRLYRPPVRTSPQSIHKRGRDDGADSDGRAASRSALESSGPPWKSTVSSPAQKDDDMHTARPNLSARLVAIQNAARPPCDEPRIAVSSRPA